MLRKRLSALGLTIILTVISAAAQQPAGEEFVFTRGQSQSESQKPRPKLKTQSDGPADNSPDRQKQDDLTLKLNTSLVIVPVIVTDRDGKYVPNLTQKNFEIYEDNVKQSIDNFISVEVPFNVVLLIDTSGSTRFKLEDIQRAALAFVGQLREQDQVMIVSFDTKIFIDSEFTNDRKQIRQAIFQTRTGGATRLYDAVDLVLTERLNKLKGRKAIVLFSDGVDTASRLANALSTIDLVEESNVLVYAIHYDTKNDVQGPLVATGNSTGFKNVIRIPSTGASDEDYRRADRYLLELADRSGARLYKADTIKDVDQAFSLIAEELRHQYALSYYPANDKRDGGYRRIRVVADRTNIAVRSRKGYRAASERQAKEK